MVKAASIADIDGLSEYEKERLKKAGAYAKAAMPSAVREFSVPTTALLQAGLFEKKKKKAILALEPFKATGAMPAFLATAGPTPAYTGYALDRGSIQMPTSSLGGQVSPSPTSPSGGTTSGGSELFRPWQPGELQTLGAGLKESGGGFLAKAIETVATKPKPTTPAPAPKTYTPPSTGGSKGLIPK